jgi:hypothetical protein
MLMLGIQCGLQTPWLLASQAGQPLSPPRALFILSVITHRRARMHLQTDLKAVRLVIPKICWFLWLQAVWITTAPVNAAIITLLTIRRQPFG